MAQGKNTATIKKVGARGGSPAGGGAGVGRSPYNAVPSNGASDPVGNQLPKKTRAIGSGER